MDVHVPQAITDQLRRRGVDVLTAIEDSSAELTDEALLERASTRGRKFAYPSYTVNTLPL
jgi:hypothetical protein